MPRGRSGYRDRRNSSYSSESSHDRKKSKSKHKKRSRSRDPSVSSSIKRRRSYCRTRQRRRSNSRSVSKDRYEKSRRRSLSRSRSRRDKSRSRSRSRSKYSDSSKKSKRSHSSSRSRSNSLKIECTTQYKSIDDTEIKVEIAIKAAEAVGLNMTKLPSYEYKKVEVKEDMSSIHDRNLIAELSCNTFVPKSLKSSRSKKNIVIDLNAETITVPETKFKVQKDDSIIDFNMGRPSSSRPPWTTGDPIVQVCVTDEDVPRPLRETVENLVSSRQKRDTARTEQQEALQQERHLEKEDEFYDVDDNQDAVLLEGRNSFEWKSMESFCAQKEVFLPTRTGSVQSHENIYDAFRSFWPESILQEIVLETNRYASEILSPSFHSDWYETNVHEVLVLFSFWMMLGILKMPTIKSCFSTNPLLQMEVFRTMFSQSRYINLTRALHFANNSIKPPNASGLYCLGPILNHLNDAFKANYVPGPNVSIDESLTLWKGVLNFRQYIRTKAVRFGIKAFELCDSTTGYLWSFIVYTGKDLSVRSTQSVLLKSTSVVLDLIQPLLNKGYCLFMDNWFNSPTLARYLKSKSTDCVGTLRARRCGVPALIQQANLKRGQLIARHCGDVVVQAWQDRKKIITISTYHDASIEPVSNGRVTQFKPKVVLDYNKYMGGVDRKDQMLEPYLMEKKRCKKWYMKLFKRLLNTSILNSRILLETSSGRQQDHLACRLCLVQAILDKHLHLTPTRTRHTLHSVEPLTRINTRHQHWPVRITQSNAPSDAGRHTRIRCVHCIKNGKKNIKTSYKCEFCNAPLCIDTCFKPFHNA